MAFLVLGNASIVGQNAYNSPYSSLGFGDLTFKGFGKNSAMGGITYGLRDNATIDFSNPASYTVRDSLSFIFEFGAVGRLSYYSKEEKKETPYDINFSHLAFSFPFGKRLSFGAGLVPYSLISYKFLVTTDEGDDEYDPELGRLDYLYQGDGGLTQVFFGTGFLITENLSLGVNIDYIFGNLESSQSLTHNSNPKAFNTRVYETQLLSGFNFNTGLQYVTTFGKDYQLVAGASYVFKSRINKTTEVQKDNILSVPEGGTVIDTLEFYTSPKEKQDFPSSFALGASIKKGEKWLFGVDFKQVQWSKSSAMNLDTLLNSQSFHAGMELTPRPREQKIYPLRIHYRLGAYYTRSFLQLYGNQITDFGITFGAGLPIGRSRSSLNIAFDYGRRGSNETNLILENHASITFSLTLYDFWFMKRKYD